MCVCTCVCVFVLEREAEELIIAGKRNVTLFLLGHNGAQLRIMEKHVEEYTSREKLGVLHQRVEGYLYICGLNE